MPFGSACARIFRFSLRASLEMGGPSPSTTLPVMSTTFPRYSASFRFIVLSCMWAYRAVIAGVS
jgi:hypothetical protein